jgi:hypothetical protein
VDGNAALDAFLSDEVTPYLRTRGFRRSGQQYRAGRAHSQVDIRFHRRRALFTVDLVVVSAFLIEEFGNIPPEHWAIRLGPSILGYDKWWDLEAGTRAIAEEFLVTLGRGIDSVEPITTDEGLRDAFLRLALEDHRGMAPIMEEWATALIRRVGPGAWGDTGER